jgi:hypothetical protein
MRRVRAVQHMYGNTKCDVELCVDAIEAVLAPTENLPPDATVTVRTTSGHSYSVAVRDLREEATDV